MNASDTAERLNVNFNLVSRHFELLERETIVEHRLSGRAKYYRFSTSAKAQVTLKLLEEWGRRL